MSARCEATNEAGARCLWIDHGGDCHFYADDSDRYAYHYGSLASAVAAFLVNEPGAGRDFLARTLAQAQSALDEAKVGHAATIAPPLR